MNIVLLCGKTLDAFSLRCMEPFWESPNHNICASVIDNRPPKTLLQKLKKHLKKGRGGYVFLMAFGSLLSRKDYVESTETFMKRKNVPIVFTDEPYSEDTINKIKSFIPDVLLLIGGFGIVKKPLLDISKHGVLSYHHGDMRKYRGMPPAFWELYHGEKQMGVTVQRLGVGLDCGEPIVEKTISIRYGDTLSSLRKRAYNESADMLFKAVSLLEKDGFIPEKITTFGRVYTLPNFRQWLVFNLKNSYRLARYKLGCKKE